MTFTDVTARIHQIQSQLALLAPPTRTTVGTGGTGAQFAQALQGASPAAPSGDDVVAEAKKYLGTPYVWGGTDPATGLDCSGLVQQVYQNLGIDLPRVSNQQATSGRPVASMAEARPGDLIAWDRSARNDGADHIAIYLGGGMMIEAPRPGLDVRITEVPTTPDMIRRIVPEAGVMPVAAGARVAANTPYADLFRAAASRYGVPENLLSAVAQTESGFDAGAVSPAGAQGLMQLMPATARGLGVTDSFDPGQAVDGAARLLRTLTNRFGSTELALAAYNAGPGAVLKYDGIPPYPETQNYVRNVLSLMKAAS